MTNVLHSSCSSMENPTGETRSSRGIFPVAVVGIGKRSNVEHIISRVRKRFIRKAQLAENTPSSGNLRESKTFRLLYTKFIAVDLSDN